MHFSALALIVATGLTSAVSGVSAYQGDSVARLGARSLIIDNDQADAIVARYYEEAGLAERDLGDEEVPRLFARDTCPYCGEIFDLVNGDMAEQSVNIYPTLYEFEKKTINIYIVSETIIRSRTARNPWPRKGRK
ncbi:unnamed protein product [Clonostachys byssicola]|uniref:Uncharacterized protein n=1 Tax=Clonostachys byssicola TaxID=160290 RepID=A0A9N9UJK5_9HYPO|nr:unnamed protein product [Clonostachys byssicola]